MNIKIWYQTEEQEFLHAELQHYFETVFQMQAEKASEADADLKVIVEKEDTDMDHICIELHGGKGTIQADSQVGVLIAAYRLFHEFGVRYLRPGRTNEFFKVLSQKDWEEKEISIEETASFRHRGVCIEGADSYENLKDFIDWLPKIGMNTFFIQFENPYSFFKRWYEHEFNPYAEKEPFSTEIAQKMSDRIDQEMKLRGIVHHRVGHGWTGEVLGYSSKYGWESGLTLPEEKKHLVAELNGKRELFGTAPILTSLDFANPEVGNKMVELIVNYAKERRDVDYLHVWLSDARNNICECEQCQKDLPSDQYIRILNQLDEALTAEGLDTKICFLLYHELLFAPEKEKIKNPERFTMMFAPITRTFEMSYEDVDYESDVPEPKAYVRNQIVLPNSLEENLSYLFAWKKMFDGDSFVYDYPLGRAHYGDLGYMKISHVIYRDIHFLKNLQLNGYISCQELRAGFPHNFPNYVMGQMLWNNTRDYEELKEEYFSSMYGENWKEVTAYLENLSAYSSCDYFNAIGERLNPVLSARYEVCVNLAEEMLSVIEVHTAESEGLQKREWKQLGYHREYVTKMAEALRLISAGKHTEAQRVWRDVLDFIRRNEMAFQQNLDVYRVIEVAKNYAGFKL